MIMATPDERMPQALLVAIASQSWRKLKARDKHASVLMDLWAPEHLARAHPAYQGRLNRLQFGLQLLEQGFRVSDHRGAALGQLMGWYIEEPALGLAEEERVAWVQVLRALMEAGQSLASPPEPSFDGWLEKDGWAWLLRSSVMAPVAREMNCLGLMRVYVPAQPHFRQWPADPTQVILDGASTSDLPAYWSQAIAQGYPLTGVQGLSWLEAAGEWDVEAKTIKAALGTGQLDVRARLPDGKTVLGKWLEVNRSLVSVSAVRALLEFDITALDDIDGMERPLSAVILDVLHLQQMTNPSTYVLSNPGQGESDLEAVKAMVNAYRLQGRLNDSLPATGKMRTDLEKVRL